MKLNFLFEKASLSCLQNFQTLLGCQLLLHCHPEMSGVPAIGHVNNIPTMQFLSGISRNTQSKSYMLSLTECVWNFQNNALWETH